MEISDREYKQFCDFIYTHSGIRLHDGKKEMVKARVGKQVRAKKLSSFREYFELVQEDGTKIELVKLLDTISTNLTYFFREPQHFKYLEEKVLTELNHAGAKKMRIWSAGCSTGEEPYTLAMVFMENMKTAAADWQILATDLSTKVLDKAIRGVYTREKVRSVRPDLLRKYFQKGVNSHTGFYKIKKELHDRIHFARLNLMESFPVKGPFDLIFCRNVMIYFDRTTQENLANRFYTVLKPGGLFFVGHSESLLGIKHNFKYLSPSIYQRQSS
jgi:chemotaxis protein methyltransferase CheR